MAATILEHLAFLYGEERAPILEQRLLAILARWRAALPHASTPRRKLALTPADVLLIAYGDQVRAPGEKPLRTLADFAAQHLRSVVSGVHLLPFYPWSSDDGFSVKDYVAVDPDLGSWEDIAAFRRNFDLMFDAVFNHLSAQSKWFRRFVAGDPAFSDFFVTVEGDPDLSAVVRPRALPLLTTFQTAAGPQKVWTTFSADQVDLNVQNPEVLLALLDVLLFYVAKGARFIRADAIAFLWKEPGTPCIHLPQTHRVIQLLRAALDEAAPQTLLITETNVPHVHNISYFGDGTNEAQLVYNFALPPLVLHSLATGNAEKLTGWAQALVLPSDGVTFFNFLASHDGIGLNPARDILSEAETEALVARALAHGGFVSYKHNPDGSKSPYEMNVNFFDALSDPTAGEPIETQVQRFLCAHAIQLALAGVPGIYFHSLFGSRGDRAGAEASGTPRRINRQKLTRAELERDLADPESLRARVFAGLTDLLRRRRQQPAFHPTAAQRVLTGDPRVFAVLRSTHEHAAQMLCLHNVSDEPVKSTLAHLGTPISLAPYEVRWEPLAIPPGNRS